MNRYSDTVKVQVAHRWPQRRGHRDNTQKPQTETEYAFIQLTEDREAHRFSLPHLTVCDTQSTSQRAEGLTELTSSAEVRVTERLLLCSGCACSI